MYPQNSPCYISFTLGSTYPISCPTTVSLFSPQPGVDRIDWVFERYLKPFSDPMRYADLFLETDADGWAVPAETIYTEERLVSVYWGEVPPDGPEPSWDLTPEQEVEAFDATRADVPPEVYAALWAETPVPPEEEYLDLPLAEALQHFHLEVLSPDRLHFFDHGHSFLIVGNKVFLTSNLDNACFGGYAKPPVDVEMEPYSPAEEDEGTAPARLFPDWSSSE